MGPIFMRTATRKRSNLRTSLKNLIVHLVCNVTKKASDYFWNRGHQIKKHNRHRKFSVLSTQRNKMFAKSDLSSFSWILKMRGRW
jgi:hypothetical protein